MAKQTHRKRRRWQWVAVASVLVVGSTAQLASFWFKRERISFLFDFDRDHPLYFDWGGWFSITEHPDPDKPGYVGITYQQWCVGPFMVRRVVYERPGSHYD
jgi:hypothetical protein